MGIKLTNSASPSENGEAAERIPAGEILTAKVSSLAVKTINYNDKQTGEPKSFDKMNWRFDITEGDYTGRSVYGGTDAFMSPDPRNRMRVWSETALGREIPPGADLDTDELLGLPVKVVIGHRPDRKDPSKVYVEVDELLPSSGGFSFDEPPF